jgi:hypothetical protein
MSRKTRVKMGMEMGGCILAPALFIFKVLVALARALGKISIRQRL